jgi:hypothetical protein
MSQVVSFDAIEASGAGRITQQQIFIAAGVSAAGTPRLS